ncbi:DUF58 domain-containing protein [Gammaproteobacteria bacterium]
MKKRRISLWMFGFVTSRTNDIKARLTTSGSLLLGGVVVSGVLSVDIIQTQAYQLFSVLSALLIVSVLFSLRFRDQISIDRKVPRHATINQSLEYSVTLTNRSGVVQDSLLVIETLPDICPTREEFLNTIQPGEKERNWFDRHVAYHRYLWLVQKKQGFERKAAPLPRISINGICQISLRLIPNRRGRIDLPGLTVMRPDPLGLIFAYQYHALPVSLLVLPKCYPLPIGFQLAGARRHHPGGMQLASVVGDSEEFVSLREYRDGDSPRHIYWPGLARHNKLLVREYQNEFFTRYGLILDTFASPAQDPEIFEEAVALAASFAVIMESGEALLDLLFVGDQAYQFTAGRSIAHVERLMEILACVDINSHDPFDRLTSLILSLPAVLSSCVLILLTWDEQRNELIRQLNAIGLPLLVLVVTAPQENQTIPTPTWIHPASRLRVIPVGQAEEILARLEL